MTGKKEEEKGKKRKGKSEIERWKVCLENINDSMVVLLLLLGN